LEAESHLIKPGSSLTARRVVNGREAVMEWLIALAALALLVLILGALIYGHYLYRRNRASRPQIDRFAVNPEVICRSNSCSVEVQWEVNASSGNLRVSVHLRQPNSQTVPLSSTTQGTAQLGASDRNLFPVSGAYFVDLEAAVGEGSPETRSLRIWFHAEDTFTIEDAWSTGFVGGSLSENDTVATHSAVLSQEPFVGSIGEIDSKLPSSITVCSKSMAMHKVVYRGGTIVGTGMRPVEVTVRRPGSTSQIAGGTLEYGDELVLPQEALVDDGLEVLSVMRSESGSSVAGSQWTLTYALRCIE
jgi:hypothetical protein